MTKFVVRSLWVIAVGSLLAAVGCGGGGSGSASGTGSITGRLVVPDPLGGRAAETFTFTVDNTDLSIPLGVDGSFAINSVAAGLHTLAIHSPRHGVAVAVQVVSGQQTSVGDLVAQDAGQISGLVTRSDNKEPIPGALITISEAVTQNSGDIPPLPVRITRTDASGSYAVPGIPVGEYVVTAAKPGYTTASATVSVAAAATTAADFSLTPEASQGTGTMTGTVYMVTDAGSQTPLAGALVRLAPKDYIGIMQPLPASVTGGAGSHPNPGPEWITFTDEQGNYTLSNIPAGDYLAVAVRAGLEPDRQSVTITAGQTLTQNFLLKPHTPRVGTVEGTVTDASTGKPIEGALVAVLFAPGPPVMSGGTGVTGGTTGGAAGVCFVPGLFRFHAKTDAQGHYALTAPAGTWTLGVAASGYLSKSAPVTVQAGATVTLNVALDPAPSGSYTVSGHVYADQNGAHTPVAGATVFFGGPIWPDPRMMAPIMVHEVVTDSQGAYSIKLPAGTYGVSAVYGDQIAPYQQIQLVQDTTLDLVLSLTVSPPPPP
ncbi:MAG: carboxypeptidase regulatory-like domain-containing protein [Chthonomonadales bacterium]